MESFILLFKHCRSWAGRCPGLLVGLLLLLTQQGWGQVYFTDVSNATLNFRYLDLTTQTVSAKAAPTEKIGSPVVYQGKIYALGFQSKNFFVYDPITNTWTAKASTPASYNGGSGTLEVAGNYIYLVIGLSGPRALYRYNPAANSWTQLTSGGVLDQVYDSAYDGGDYIYSSSNHVFAGTPYPLARYSISGDSWFTLPMPTTPANFSYGALTFQNGKLYITSGTKFYSYDPSSSTYTSLLDSPSTIINLISGGGNYLYGGAAADGIYRYDLSANTWTKLSTFAATELTYLGTQCSVTGSVTATPTTCAGTGGANANATLTLTAHSGGATKVGYSVGSSYSGPDFATAVTVTTAPMVLTSTLTNPSAPQPYTIRLFQDATCYKDVVATLAPTLCLTSDLSLSLSPATQSGSKGEILTYTFTLTNAGPDAASDVQVDIKVPTNATLLTASPQLGTYSDATHKWEVSSLPVGSKNLTVTLKMN